MLDGRKRKTVEQRAGPAAPIVFFLLRANFAVRVPIAKHFIPIQSLFRISQNWGLYGGGPPVVYRLQIEVDGEPVYQTNHPTLQWNIGPLSHRKVRPMPDTMVTKPEAYNWDGFSRWVLKEAREDFPDATDVAIVALTSDRTEDAELSIRHGRVARAPEWSWERFGKNGVPDDSTYTEPAP